MKFSRLNFGEIENVVEESQQAVARTADRVGKLKLFFGEGGIEQKTRHADDGIHRGADFMTHGGEEVRLGLGGSKGFIPRLRKGMFCGFSAGDVFSNRQESGHDSVTVPECGDSQEDSQPAAVFSLVRPFPFIEPASFGIFDQGGNTMNRALIQVAEFPGMAVDFLGHVQQGERLLPDHLAGGITQQLFCAGVEGRDRPLGIGGDDGHIGCAGKDGLQLQIGREQGPFQVFASLDVGGNDLDGRFPLEHNRGCRYFDIDDGAGETDKPLLGGRDRSIRVAYFRDSLPYLGVRFGMDELEDGLPE